MTKINQTLALAEQLIRAESISPADAGCQKIIGDYLQALGFVIEPMPFGDVENLWAFRPGSNKEGPVFAFAGHTDVVPTGPLEQWSTPPFKPVIKDGVLFGRGAADMKGSLAAMLTAVKQFIADVDNYDGTIGFLITSDEEADAVNGTVKVIEALHQQGTHINWCLVGEPTSSQTLGDVIRVGRRGSLNANLKIIGQQGHVAYPNDATNPIHQAAQALADLAAARWDEGNKYFPPTTMQMSNIHAGAGVNNVIPGEMEVVFNFRFSTESSEQSLRTQTHQILDRYDFDYQLDWQLSGNPFMTEGGELIPAVQSCLRDEFNIDTDLSTAGGTSDGRFIAPYGTQVVELGPCNRTIHKIDECVSVQELDDLSRVYCQILKKLLT